MAAVILADDPEDQQIVLADDPKTPEESVDLPDPENVDIDVVKNLPTTLQFMFWDTQIPISKEVSAAMVGMGDMMLDTYHGVKQILGFDEESMRQDQKYMNDLYESDVGGYAIGGAVAGALAEPIGFLIPAGKAGSVGKAFVRGAGIGAGFGATGYVDEEKGQTRLGNTLIGAGLGGTISGGIRTVGLKTDARKFRKANDVINDVETLWAEKIVDGIDPNDISAQIRKELPEVTDALQKSTQITGRFPNLVTDPNEAADVIRSQKTFTKQNDLSLVMDKVAGIMSTRVRNISEPIFGRLRQYDRNVKQKTHDILDESYNFLNGLKGFNSKNKAVVDRALANGDFGTVRGILKDSGGDQLVTEFNKVINRVDDLGDQLLQSGRITNKLDNYFPRYVKDKDGLFNAIGLTEKSKVEKALADAIKKNGTLTPLQESDIINKALRGYPLKGSKPGFAKRRGILRLDEDLMQYYATPEESLHTYIRNAITDLEKTKFFGKDV
ncbi:MAG: hypothetical protein KJO69_03770 [Gammaproteobacteria bacterium]|nr:hypothetical protein [Gammaproteobacteria bacterium]